MSLVLLVACAAGVSARVYTSDNGFKVAFPDDWMVSIDGGSIVGKTADRELVLVLSGRKGDSARSIADGYMQVLKKDVDEATNSEPARLKNMEWEATYGTRTIRGQKFSYRVDIVGSNGTYLAIYSVWVYSAMEKRRAEFVSVLRSIEPPAP